MSAWVLLLLSCYGGHCSVTTVAGIATEAECKRLAPLSTPDPTWVVSYKCVSYAAPNTTIPPSSNYLLAQ